MSQSPATLRDDDTHDYRQAWTAIFNMIKEGRSWSGNEKNCVFLNVGAERFADFSAVTGLDFADDGRAALTSDWDLDGDLDLWLSNRTAPRLRFMRNELGSRSGHLAVRLRGTRSNRDGIGARLELQLPGGRRIATLHAGQGFLSQDSKWMHFGLGDASRIESLVVRWPGGEAETFTGIEPDRRYELVEGSGLAREWSPPEREVRLTPTALEAPADSDKGRVVLSARPPMPTLGYTDPQGQTRDIGGEPGRPVLVNLWASWCAPCLKELKDFAEHHDELRARGLDVLALSVDEPDKQDEARAVVERLELPFATGFAPLETIDALEILQGVLIMMRRSIALPSSFLIDGDGRLALIYRGPVSGEQLLADLYLLPLDGEALRRAAQPFPGRWFSAPPRPPIEKLARDFLFHERPELAMEFLAESSGRSIAVKDGTFREDFNLRGDILGQQADRLEQGGRRDEALLLYEAAAGAYRSELEIDPGHAEAANNLGVALLRLDRPREAIAAFRQALARHPEPHVVGANLVRALGGLQQPAEALGMLTQLREERPDDAWLRRVLGRLLEGAGRLAEAEVEFHRLVELAPDDVDGRLDLGRVLARQQRLDDAAVHYRHALAIAPDHSKALKELGLVHALLGQTSEALRYTSRAAELVPDDPILQLDCGKLNIALGKHQAALDNLARLEQLRPDLAVELRDGIRQRFDDEDPRD